MNKRAMSIRITTQRDPKPAANRPLHAAAAANVASLPIRCTVPTAATASNTVGALRSGIPSQCTIGGLAPFYYANSGQNPALTPATPSTFTGSCSFDANTKKLTCTLDHVGQQRPPTISAPPHAYGPATETTYYPHVYVPDRLARNPFLQFY